MTTHRICVELAVVGMMYLLPSSASFADWKSDSISDVCSYLDSEGLPTRGYKNIVDEDYAASSDYKNIGTAALPNNIAYYVNGVKEQATELRLVLNVNAPSVVNDAKKEFAKAVNALVKKAVGQSATGSILQSIAADKPGQWTSGASSISLDTEKWPSGNGYEIRLVISNPPVADRTSGTSSRLWTDLSGKFSLAAEFAGIINGKVRLRKENGEVVSIELEKLSDVDQKWIEELRK